MTKTPEAVPALHTERLVLDQLTEDDAPFLVELLTDPSFLRNIGDRGVRRQEDVAGYLDGGPRASYRRHGFGLLRVLERASGEPIGVCGLIRRPTLDDVDVGFALLPRFWGRGYAFEAAERVARHAFEELGIRRLVAITNPDNAGSIRVLEKLGMRFERTIRLEAGQPKLRLYALERTAVERSPEGESSPRHEP